jgi:hypothetical protein
MKSFLSQKTDFFTEHLMSSKFLIYRWGANVKCLFKIHLLLKK